MMARTTCMTRYSLLALLQLMFTVAQVTALDVDVGPALVLQDGDDATLQCNYTTTQSASSGELTWTFNNGSGDVTVYQRQGSTEVPSADYVGRLTFTGDLSNGIANIRLSNMQKKDSGSYTCSVLVLGDGQDSKSITVTVIEPTTVAAITTRAPVTNPGGQAISVISGTVVIVFLCQALLAAIIMIAILTADACGTCNVTCTETCTEKCTGTCTEVCSCTCTCDTLKILTWIGAVVGVVLAVVVIILACDSPNSGYGYQHGFTLVILLTSVAPAMSIVAASLGCLFQKTGNGVNFPVATMSLYFFMGLPIAIAGTVASAIYVKDLKVVGIALGAISIILLVAAFIWFMVRVCCGKKQCSRVSQDFSEARSQNQVELEQQSAQAEGITAISAQPFTNEKE